MSAHPPAPDQNPESSSPTAPARARELLLLSWWFALVAGFGFTAMQYLRRYVIGEFSWVSRDVYWMSPLSFLVLFVPIALLLAVVLRGRPGARALAVGIFAFLTVLAQLLPHSRLAEWAQVALALGVAVQGARWYRRHQEAAQAMMWRTASVATVLVLGGVVADEGSRALQRRTALTALPTAAAGSPNVLFIILDTVRQSELSVYGYGKPTTPQLERRAAEFALFDRAYATAPWTLPSHGTLMTGRFPRELRFDWRRPLHSDGRTLAEVLGERGYHTGGFVANLAFTSYEAGIARGFLDYSDYPATLRMALKHNPLVISHSARRLMRVRSLRDVGAVFRGLGQTTEGPIPWHPVNGKEITDAFLDWQSQVGERPYFAFLNFMDAHEPYRAPDSLIARFGKASREQDRYDAAIAFIDSELGRLMGELEKRGTLDRTVVVISSDHGELFGEHGLTGHAQALYLPLLHVPLIIRYPARVAGGSRVAAPVSLRDLPATILDLAGVEQGAMPGASLAWTWQGAEGATASPLLSELSRGHNVNPRQPNAKTDHVSLIAAGAHYIRSGLGKEELYDIAGDPGELRDLSKDEASQQALRQR